MYHLSLLLLSLFIRNVVPVKVDCGNSPADIVFVLDSSSSIWPPHYELMLKFLQNFAESFQIGPEKVQIGVVSYSDQVFEDFQMKDHQEKDALKASIGAVQQKFGGTNTAGAIRTMYSSSFTRRAGMRADVPRLGFVITDGVSKDKGKTMKAAKKAQDAGILMYAIGVGDTVNYEELLAIAGDKERLFTVDNFEALDSIRDMISIKVCKTACGERSPADIVFMIDSYKSGDSNTKKALDFVGDLSQEFEIAADKIKVGLVHQCMIGGWQLDRYNTKEQLAEDVQSVTVTDFTDLLKRASVRSFTVEEGGRPGAKRVAVAILDSRFPNPEKTKAVAKRAKEMEIEIFIIGIGTGVNYQELTVVASAPADKHVFTVSTYDDLVSLKEQIKIAMCEDL